MTERFHVDLRGIVDLLSRHLYSSPRVYVRELAQNAVDAVTARGDRGSDPRPAARFTVHPDGMLECFDSGTGLTPEQMEQFLATIGASAKRDELGFQREDLLGQFGIGLLSAFMIADRIEVVSRHSTSSEDELAWWTGSDDGTYTITSGVEGRADPADGRLAWLAQGPGTCVRLTPRPDCRSWTAPHMVLQLARTYLSYLSQEITVEVLGTEPVTHPISPTAPPWLADGRDAGEVAGALLGVRPFATLPLTVPEAGLRGLAVISADPLPGRSAGHRVHLKGMLLGDDIVDLAPAWAVFCRCVVDTSVLRPTASREQLYDDDLLERVRMAIGEELTRWMRRLAQSDPARMRAFLHTHHIALKAAALDQDDLLDVLVPLTPFESTRGVVTVQQLVDAGDPIAYVDDVDGFRRISAVASAQGMVVLNAGYVYDADLLARWTARHPETTLTRIAPQDLELHLDLVDDDRALALRGFLQRAEASLSDAAIAVQLRRFAPGNVPALLLDDSAAWRERDRQATAATADDVFAALLASAPATADVRPRLILNDAHPTVRRVAGLSDPVAAALAVQSFYARALLAGRHPIRPVDAAIVETSFAGLLDVLVTTAEQPGSTS